MVNVPAYDFRAYIKKNSFAYFNFSRKCTETSFFPILLQILPPGTFVHRCDSSGCCLNYKERCLPKRTEEITVTFGIFDKKVDEIYLTLTNHTECWCQDIDKLKKHIIKKR